MNGLSQFLVSIFHFRGEKREQSCGEAGEGRIKGLTNNILIFSAHSPISSSFSMASQLSHFINRSPRSNSTSLRMLSLIPPHFNLISPPSLLSLFRSMLGMCYVLPLPHISPGPSLSSSSTNHEAWQALHQSSSPATPSTAVLQWILQPGAARLA